MSSSSFILPSFFSSDQSGFKTTGKTTDATFPNETLSCKTTLLEHSCSSEHVPQDSESN